MQDSHCISRNSLIFIQKFHLKFASKLEFARYMVKVFEEWCKQTNGAIKYLKGRCRIFLISFSYLPMRMADGSARGHLVESIPNSYLGMFLRGMKNIVWEEGIAFILSYLEHNRDGTPKADLDTSEV